MGTSREKLYQQLGLESLRLQRLYRNRFLFYEVFKNKHPQYLFVLLPVRHSPHTSRNAHNIPVFNAKHLSLYGTQWNKLDLDIECLQG